MAAVDLLQDNPTPSDEEIRRGPRGQPLPLHRLPEHRRRGPPGRRAERGGDCVTEDRRRRRRRAVESTRTQIDRAGRHQDIGRPLQAQGGRAARHRPDPVDRQHPARPACCTWRSCAARWRTPRINRVDVSAALQRPGVIAAFSGADLGDELGTLPCAWPVTDGHGAPRPPAAGRRRGAGTSARRSRSSWPRDRYAAADALEAIEVDYEPLPAVIDMEEALAGRGAGPLRQGHQQVLHCGRSTGGDYDAARAQAEAEGGVVFKRRYIQQRLHPDRDGAARGGRRAAAPQATSTRSTRPPRSRTSCG